MRTEERIEIKENDVSDVSRNSPADLSRGGSFLTVPLSERGVPKFIVYLLSFVGFVYILNPSLGIIELIPDVTPIVGNLDEGGAYMLLWYGLIEFFDGRKRRRQRG